MRALTYFVAATLDGYIAGKDGAIDGFPIAPELVAHLAAHWPETLPAPARTHLGLTDVPNRRFDTVVMGRHTHAVGADQGLLSPYPHLEQVVCSRTLDLEVPGLEVVREDPARAIRQLKARDGLGIWLCGGGRLAAELLDEIDALVVKRHPLLFGDGIPMVRGVPGRARFALKDRTDVAGVCFETWQRMR